jgi:CelD/BcsL family acetyltransferase involved in cellulose biosynthesis
MDGAADKDGASGILHCMWTAALEELSWDTVDLRHVPSGSPLVPALDEALDGQTFVIEEDEVCPVALLCSTWYGYLQMLTKKQRHEIRRKLRRAQEGAQWSWRTAESRPDLDRDMPTFFRLHELSGREKARFMTEGMREFFRDMAADFLDRGVLRLSIFSREGQDIAATLGFLYRDRYLLYNSGYDPAQSAFSPGIAAVSHAMQDAIEHKAVAFDFLSGDEPYKYQFGATNTHTCRVRVTKG